MIIALIPTYGDRGYLDNMINWLNDSQEVDAIELLHQENPQGSATARNKLIADATNKYGYDHYFLMLDDDCRFCTLSRIRKAAKLFEDNNDIGIISFPVGGVITSGYAESIIVKHCFLINGELIKAGAIYTPGEIYDSLDMCIQSYLLGYRNVVTKEAIIWHNVSPDTSIRWKLVNEGFQSATSGIMARYAQYIDKYIEPYTVILNQAAHALHNERNIIIKNGTNSTGNI